MSDRYLVTGAAGFIGSHIVERLVREGKAVRAIDNLATGSMENLRPFLHEIEFVKDDLTDLAQTRAAVEGMDWVLHQAAIPSVPRSVTDPIASNAANVDGLVYLLVAARDAGVKRVVCASSSSVYGDAPTLPQRENMRPEPRSPYAVSKLCGEFYGGVFHQLYALETVFLRYFNVFGPRQDPESQYAAVVPRFITALLRGERPLIFGDGEQSRDFTYVENVVEANLLAAEAPDAAGEVFNIACGARISVNRLARILADLIGVDIQPKYVDQRPGDIRHSLADISKARTLLGYDANVDIREGLSRTVAWYSGRDITER